MTRDEAPIQIEIGTETDIVTARTLGKDLARTLGFGTVDQTRIATGISELARNILQYAGRGYIRVQGLVEGSRHGLEIVAADRGPGIRNVDAVLDGETRSARGLGLGIPGTRRLMDEFQITTEQGEGTRVRCIKWL